MECGGRAKASRWRDFAATPLSHGQPQALGSVAGPALPPAPTDPKAVSVLVPRSATALHKNPLCVLTVWLCLGGLVVAQEPRPPTAAVEGIKGVKEDAVAKVKHVEPGVATGTKSTAQGIKGVKEEAVAQVKNIETGSAAASGGVVAGTKSSAQGVNKIDGIDTIDGVKADGRTAVVPVQPGVQPVISGAGSIQAVNGVTGINAAKLQNLEAALQLKHDGGGTPTGKGKAAAAALGAPGPGIKPGPKKDGRDGFQEFEKLKTNGS